MISLSSLSPSQDRQKYKRVGRGNSSGKGTTAGRGTKGQRARTGGRNKLTRRGLKHIIERTPKSRGFLSRRPEVAVVTLSQIQGAFPDGHIVTPSMLRQAGLVGSTKHGVKVIGSAIVKKMTIKATQFSVSAAAAITKAGGQALTKPVTPEPSKEA